LSTSRRFPGHGWFGLAVLGVAQISLFVGIEVVSYWFYPLAWWSYILIADALVYYRKGTSLLTHHFREFFLLLSWSISLWLLFEMFNIRLHNWHYTMVPINTTERWLGYIVSYATVLPGLFETMEVFESYGLLQNCRTRPLASSSHWYAPFVFIGLIFLLLPLLWPQFFFPLVWGGFIFLLEPLNHHFGAPSLMRQWQEGSLRTFYLLLLSGAVCGLLWEFWNYWAATKWEYTVPFVGRLKLFEMPLLGFLGFPPFAVQCYVIMNTISLCRHGHGWQNPQSGRFRPISLYTILAVPLFLTYWIFAFHQIDVHTVASWRP